MRYRAAHCCRLRLTATFFYDQKKTQDMPSELQDHTSETINN